jgi:phenylacetate-CoA ligase
VGFDRILVGLALSTQQEVNMNYSKKRILYERMPGWLRDVLWIIPFEWLAGRAYRETVRRGPVIDRMSRSEIRAYQDKALRSILEFACEQVPTYRRCSALLAKGNALEVLAEFPLLDKDTLQNRLPEYLPRDFNKIPHYECSTGGTTGNQIRIYLDNNSQSIEMGFMHRMWARVGHKPSLLKATFRGAEFGLLPKDIHWKSNPIYHEIRFSPYHINEKTLNEYVGALFSFKPKFLHGYPSAISLLARYALAHGINLGKLNVRAVLLASEAVYADQREIIERAFATRAFSWYGHSERVILAGECEQDRSYHHFPDYGILEIVREDGSPADEGERGELVGTGLLNRSMPLIRYRTGDFARKLPPACQCGRYFDRFDDVEPHRKTEFVIGKNGGLMSLAALNVHGPEMLKVLRFQYYQNKPGVVDVRLMVTSSFNDFDRQAIRKMFLRKLGDSLDVNLVIVPDIPLTPCGKFRRLIQECSRELQEATAQTGIPAKQTEK